ncbi:hypothetical protein DAMA08_034220 [Martiniozyma asiatica (nom. inval.)]|nr:hypothetical protein DAMA08_034220 [Martiniozyma asiatica]
MESLDQIRALQRELNNGKIATPTRRSKNDEEATRTKIDGLLKEVQNGLSLEISQLEDTWNKTCKEISDIESGNLELVDELLVKWGMLLEGVQLPDNSRAILKPVAKGELLKFIKEGISIEEAQFQLALLLANATISGGDFKQHAEYLNV